MEDLFIIMLCLIFVVAFIIALIEGIIKGLFSLICALFAGAGIYGIITAVGIVVFIIAIIYIIKG